MHAQAQSERDRQRGREIAHRVGSQPPRPLPNTSKRRCVTNKRTNAETRRESACACESFTRQTVGQRDRERESAEMARTMVLVLACRRRRSPTSMTFSSDACIEMPCVRGTHRALRGEHAHRKREKAHPYRLVGAGSTADGLDSSSEAQYCMS